MTTRLRHLAARLITLTVLTGGLTATAGPAPARAATASACTSTLGATVSVGGAAYDLFESNGVVVSCGGASLFGSLASSAPLPSPVVTGAATHSGSGYWLVTANGGVHNYGSAGFFGSPVHLKLASPIVSFAPTPDGGGYWLVTASGTIFHFGDAVFAGSTVRDRALGTVVAIVSSPDGKGYWIVTATGRVKSFGDATPVGDLAHRRPPVVAAASGPDGRSLVLVTKDGGVHTLGTAGYYGSLVHKRLSRPLTAVATSPDGAGYLLVTAAGVVDNFGDAAFLGSLATSPPKRPVRVVAATVVTLPTPITTATLTSVTTGVAATGVAPSSLVPHGAFGYDISNYQCSSPGASTASSSLPSSSPFSVIEAAGWTSGPENSCLAAEAAWANGAEGSAGAHYSLYIFMNSPDQTTASTAIDGTGPAGVCSTLPAASQAGCVAYNYGYAGALAAFNGAGSIGVSAPLWWLDVEGSNLSSTNYSNFSSGVYWSSSTALNADTIQGAVDALRSVGVVVGIYSTSVQFPKIAGSYVPTGAQVPLWVAGVPWTSPPYTEPGLVSPSVLPGWCAGSSGYSTQVPSDLFAGGVPWLLQETPGTEASPYNIDPDYAC